MQKIKEREPLKYLLNKNLMKINQFDLFSDLRKNMEE